MADENRLDENEATFGVYGDPAKVLVFTIPIAKYAEDEVNGAAMVYGKLREFQGTAMQILAELRKRKHMTNGLVKPNGLNLA